MNSEPFQHATPVDLAATPAPLPACLEDVAEIDVRALARRETWGKGRAEWIRLVGRGGSELRVEVSSWEGCALLRTLGAESTVLAVTTVLIPTSPGRFGGERAWWCCPRC